MSEESAKRKQTRTLIVAIFVGAAVCLTGAILFVVGFLSGAATFSIQLFGSDNPCTGTNPAELALKVGLALFVSGPILGWVGIPTLAVWRRRRPQLAWTIASASLAVVALTIIAVATGQVCR